MDPAQLQTALKDLAATKETVTAGSRIYALTQRRGAASYCDLPCHTQVFEE